MKPYAQLSDIVERRRWILFDTSVQYYLIQVNLATRTTSELHQNTLEDQSARTGTGNVISIQNVVRNGAVEPIPEVVRNLWRPQRRDPTYGCGRYARKGIRIVEAPGNRMAIIRHPYAVGLGRALENGTDDLESGNT